MWFLLLVAVLMLGGGVAVLRQALPTWRLAKAAERWPSVPGRIVRSEVEARQSDKAIYYYPLIGYEYSAGNRTYYSERQSFNPEPSHTKDAAAFHVAKYTYDQQVTVSYDPADPSSAVLEARFVSLDLYLLACLLGMALLLGGLAIGIAAIANR